MPSLTVHYIPLIYFVQFISMIQHSFILYMDEQMTNYETPKKNNAFTKSPDFEFYNGFSLSRTHWSYKL